MNKIDENKIYLLVVISIILFLILGIILIYGKKSDAQCFISEDINNAKSISIPGFVLIPITKKRMLPFYIPEGVEIRKAKLRKDGSIDLRIRILCPGGD